MSVPKISEKFYEGVFGASMLLHSFPSVPVYGLLIPSEQPIAINKPKSISSAEVLRELRKEFNRSTTFTPWLENERAKLAQIDKLNNFHRRRKSRRLTDVKLGHGGTLDPMATGVLIVGVGNGTKDLLSFLSCTKTYEATILFGAATDTYDVMGKVIAKAPYGHITKQKVEDALATFRGKIMQRPPIYSALRMEGKKLYEYAREGKDPPREIEERPMEVKELEIVEWLEAPDHKYKWPSEEAELEDQLVAEKVLHLKEVSQTSADDQSLTELPSPGLGKRKRMMEEEDDLENVRISAPKRKEEDPLSKMSGALPCLNEDASTVIEDSGPSSTSAGLINDASQPGPPAVKLRMTVTSGFYVRSLSHDLGKRMNSLGIMCELVRTRQADFRIGQNVMEFEDLAKGENSWGPRVQSLLDEWEQKTSEPSEEYSDKLKASGSV